MKISESIKEEIEYEQNEIKQKARRNRTQRQSIIEKKMK